MQCPQRKSEINGIEDHGIFRKKEVFLHRWIFQIWEKIKELQALLQTLRNFMRLILRKWSPLINILRERRNILNNTVYIIN